MIVCETVRVISICAVSLIVLILLGVLSSSMKVGSVEAADAVYIRADGSVDPLTAPIQRVGDTYTFEGDANASLVVQRDNIVVDGAGYALTGTGSGAGVDLSGRTGVTVRNLGIRGFENGVYMSLSFNNTLTGNNISANTDYGVNTDYFNGCSGNRIVNNSITGNGALGDGAGRGGGGVHLDWASSNSSVIDNYVADNISHGICVVSENNSLIDNNVTANAGLGIYVWANNFTLRNNSMAGNQYNFGLELGGVSYSAQTRIVDVSNTVEDKPIYYWVDEHGEIVPSDAGYVALVNCSDITVMGLNLSNNGQGIALLNSEDCSVTENEIAHNKMGFWIEGGYETVLSRNNSITHNNITESPFLDVTNSFFTTISDNLIQNNAEVTGYLDISGSKNTFRHNNVTNVDISLTGSPDSDVSYNNMDGADLTLDGTSNAMVTHNNITHGTTGILLTYSSCDNTICNNDVEASQYDGVYLSYSSSNNNVSSNRIGDNRLTGLSFSFSSNGNTVCDNQVENNRCGAFLDFDSSNNIFAHNNFINNTRSVDISFGQQNQWDAAYPSGGNYWSDYAGADAHSGAYQNETGCDGVGDTPVVLDPVNVDRYPLMKPYSGPHDIGVKASAFKTVVPERYAGHMWLNATVLNYGEQSETFNLTLQIGAAIREQTLTLTTRNSTMQAFDQNVSTWAKGDYELRVEAPLVPGETDTSDNTYTGLLVITITGDVNGDHRVDMWDVGSAASLFGANYPNPRYNANCDVNDDDKINMKDIGTIAKHYGETWQ